MSELFAEITEIAYRGKLPDHIVDRMVRVAKGETIICPDCEGKGTREVMDMDSVTSRSSTYPDDITVTCERCNGEGEIPC